MTRFVESPEAVLCRHARERLLDICGAVPVSELNLELHATILPKKDRWAEAAIQRPR